MVDRAAEILSLPVNDVPGGMARAMKPLKELADGDRGKQYHQLGRPIPTTMSECLSRCVAPEPAVNNMRHTDPSHKYPSSHGTTDLSAALSPLFEQDPTRSIHFVYRKMDGQFSDAFRAMVRRSDPAGELDEEEKAKVNEWMSRLVHSYEVSGQSHSPP